MKSIFTILCFAAASANSQTIQQFIWLGSQPSYSNQLTSQSYTSQAGRFTTNTNSAAFNYTAMDSLSIIRSVEYFITQSTYPLNTTRYSYQKLLIDNFSDEGSANNYWRNLVKQNASGPYFYVADSKLVLTNCEDGSNQGYNLQTILPNYTNRLYDFGSQSTADYTGTYDDRIKILSTVYQPSERGTNFDYQIVKSAAINETVINNGTRIGMIYKRDELVTNNGTAYDIFSAAVSNSINPGLRASVNNGISLNYEAAYKLELSGTDYKPWLTAQVNNAFHPGTILSLNTEANLSSKNSIGAFEITNSQNSFSFGTTGYTTGMIGFKKWEGTSLNIQSGTLNVFGSMSVNGLIRTTGFQINGQDGLARFDVSPSSFVLGGGIGHPSALLVLNSHTQGTLLTRMTTHERRSMPNPANGLITYDTDLNKYMFFNGEAWEMIVSTPFDRPYEYSN